MSVQYDLAAAHVDRQECLSYPPFIESTLGSTRGESRKESNYVAAISKRNEIVAVLRSIAATEQYFSSLN